MAEQHQQHRPTHDTSRHLHDKGPSTSQVLAVATLFPVGGFLLGLAGLILTGTLFGLAVSTPLFLIFSPIIVPAVIAIALAVAGFLTSGVFGITALSSVSWIFNYFRRMRANWPEQFDQARRRVGDTASHMGQKAQDAVRA
ncbi:Oleosin family protein [Perilla frutescens var. hirtella]|nr:Oleosin family protein [Perilla frutescens var. hirtella]